MKTQRVYDVYLNVEYSMISRKGFIILGSWFHYPILSLKGFIILRWRVNFSILLIKKFMYRFQQKSSWLYT
jgi:hypothetical protein